MASWRDIPSACPWTVGKVNRLLLNDSAYLGEMKGLAEGLCGSEACRGLMGWKLKWRFLVETARPGL